MNIVKIFNFIKKHPKSTIIIIGIIQALIITFILQTKNGEINEITSKYEAYRRNSDITWKNYEQFRGDIMASYNNLQDSLRLEKRKFKVKYIKDTLNITDTLYLQDSIYVDDAAILALLEREINNPYMQDIIKEYLKTSNKTYGTISFSDSAYKPVPITVSVDFPYGNREVKYFPRIIKEKTTEKYIGVGIIDGTPGIAGSLLYKPWGTNLGLILYQKKNNTKLGLIINFKL